MLVNKFNMVVSVNGNKEVYTTYAPPGRRLRLVSPCLFSLAPGCVSISPADDPDSFVRHYNYKLVIEKRVGARNPDIFPRDASFLVCENCFFPSYNAYQSVNYPGFYITSAGDNAQLGIVQLDQNPSVEFLMYASFTNEQ